MNYFVEIYRNFGYNTRYNLNAIVIFSTKILFAGNTITNYFYIEQKNCF